MRNSRVALEELRRFGSYEHLNERISSFPRDGDTVTAIFTQVIDRLVEEFDRETTQTVLTLFASARRGLSERELLELELLANVSGRGDLFPVLRQLRPFLLNRAGLIGFVHDRFRQAVQSRFHTDTDEDQRAVHCSLAKMFHGRLFEFSRVVDRKSPDVRALKYLPYHAREGSESQIWFETMTDFAYLEAVVARVDVGQGEDADGT